MRTVSLGLLQKNAIYPDCVTEYIFNADPSKFIFFEDYLSELRIQSYDFIRNLRSRSFGAIRLNVYVPNDQNTAIALTALLSAIYCSALMEINIFHYISEDDCSDGKWISQNFQKVQEIDRDIIVSLPHTVNDAYY